MQIVEELVQVSCGSCGQPFGITETFYQARRRDHKTFWCPNGCARAYRVESEIEVARRQRDEARNQRDAAQREAKQITHRLRAERGHVTRLKRRAAAGVCPCCHRSFAALRRHMAAKHPKYPS